MYFMKQVRQVWIEDEFGSSANLVLPACLPKAIESDVMIYFS